jgi:hypothetical protein
MGRDKKQEFRYFREGFRIAVKLSLQAMGGNLFILDSQKSRLPHPPSAGSE